MSPVRFLLAMASSIALAWIAPRASAQLELPSEPVAPPAIGGGVPALPEAPRGELLGRTLGRDPYSEPRVGQDPLPPSGGLDLPAAPVRPPAPSPAAPSPAKTVPSETAPTDEVPAAGPNADAPRKDAAAFIFAEVRRLADPESRLVEQAAQSLIALEEPGRVASRAALKDDHPAVLLASAKVLLTSPDAADRALVRKRLSGKLPTGACGALVDAFARLDPVAANPAALCALLDHSQQGVRAAAQRHLEAHRDGALLPLLQPALASERTDTRLRALELVQAIDDPGVVPILMDRLRDRAATVAGRAALALAASTDERVERELRQRAFDQQWILRESAYAILALVEREDVRLTPCLDDRHVAPLLQGLASSDPFVAGSCAAALAGLGFRSPALADVKWLDLEVPHTLVRAVAGLEFHNDFSSLQRTAVRRLALISGQSIGPDGPAWLAWWSAAAPNFRSRRAVLAATPEDASTISLYYATTLGDPEAFRLLGPTAPAIAPSSAIPCETLRLSQAQARDLFDVLERDGVFGAERLPGVRGGSSAAARTLDVGIAGRAKSFGFTSGSTDAWFDKLVATAESLRDRNRWQRYPDPARHKLPVDLWYEQSAWWDGEHSQLERDLRMKVLALTNLAARPADERDGGTIELLRLYENPDLVEPGDFAPLVAMLRQEPALSGRAERLFDLAIRHIGPDKPDAEENAVTLARTVIERFGESSAPLLARVVAVAGPNGIRRASKSAEPLVRAASTGELARLDTPEDRAALIELLKDQDERVEIAAIVALGEHQVEEARTELLLRARLRSSIGVRAAALESIGAMRGEGVLDALVVGLADNEQAIKTAAARGLATLGDRAAAPLLISLLGQGRETDVFEPARAGLLELGEAGWADLLRAVNTPGNRARRECALLLSVQGVPQAAPVLIGLLTDQPGDAFVAAELAVLTCMDLRQDGNPSGAWWDWWEGVVHDDSLSWLRAALEREGVSAPASSELAGAGTRAGALFLLDVLGRKESHLVERARRELSRMLGEDLGTLPAPGGARVARLIELRTAIDRRWP
jgi:HEAT repeat protein